MEINLKKLGLITASVVVSVGSLVGSYHLGAKNATQEIVDGLTELCTRRAIIEAPDGRRFACFGIPHDGAVPQQQQQNRDRGSVQEPSGDRPSKNNSNLT